MKKIVVVLAATLLVASCVTEKNALNKLRPELPRICGDMFPPRDCVIVIVGPDYSEEAERLKRAADSMAKIIESLPESVHYDDTTSSWVVTVPGGVTYVFDTCKDKKSVSVPVEKMKQLLDKNRKLQQGTAEFIYMIEELKNVLEQRDSTIKIYRANTAKEKHLQDGLLVALRGEAKYKKLSLFMGLLALVFLILLLVLKRK